MDLMSAFLAPIVCWKRSRSSLCSDQCDVKTVSIASIARSSLLLRSVLVQSWKSKSQFNKRGRPRMASNAQPSEDLSGKLVAKFGARASSVMQESALNVSKGHSSEVCNVAPRASRLSPDQAKQLLLQRADINDPQVQCMLRQIEEPRRKQDLIELLAARCWTGVAKERNQERL